MEAGHRPNVSRRTPRDCDTRLNSSGEVAIASPGIFFRRRRGTYEKLGAGRHGPTGKRRDPGRPVGSVVRS